MAPKSIPDRWLDYNPVGERVGETRFIAFKVPLKQGVIDSVQEDLKLTCNILLTKIPNLGMIIDLTNTYRYYSPNFFTENGITYKKLMIPGHAVPPRDLVKKFKNMVKNYLSENSNNDTLIGVHCTHGVNRTGYLICNFMISEMNIQADEAIKSFEAARGHAIERQNYRTDLETLANKVETYANWDGEQNNHMVGENWQKVEDNRNHRSHQLSSKYNWRSDNRPPSHHSNTRGATRYIGRKGPLVRNTNHRLVVEDPQNDQINGNRWSQHSPNMGNWRSDHFRGLHQSNRYTPSTNTIGSEFDQPSNNYNNNNKHHAVEDTQINARSGQRFNSREAHQTNYKLSYTKEREQRNSHDNHQSYKHHHRYSSYGTANTSKPNRTNQSNVHFSNN